MFSFFQNCWHLKDWVKHDPLVPEDQKRRIITVAETSRVLAIANDMANSTKRLVAYDPKVPASYLHTLVSVSGAESRLECVIEVEGVHMIASAVAQECVAEWERILTTEGLAIEPLGS